MGRMKSVIHTAAVILTMASGCASETSGQGDDEPGPYFEGSGGGGGGGGGGSGSGTPEEGGPDVEDTDTLPTYPTAHPRIYLGPNKARLQSTLSSTAGARFKAKVDQWLGGSSIWGFQSWNGALVGQLTGNAAYCTKAIATVEAQVVAAEVKISANLAPEVAHDSYLYVGELIGDLALVYDWCFDGVTAAQRTRWIAYANNAVANVWNHTGAKWGSATIPWTGWSVNNPSNNYYYSFLRATMLLGLATKGENPRADEWITKFRDEKILGQLVPTFNADLVGGGSREGTGYGVAMRNLFEIYDWWHATTGEKLHTKTNHTRYSLISFMHQTVPTLDRVAPTGDHPRDSTAAYFDYHRAYLSILMTLFPDDASAQRAKQLLAGSSVPSMSQAFMLAYDFLYDASAVQAQPLTGMGTAYYARGIGEIYARSGWDTNATWVNLVAGPYTESHAHQDQGSLMIYKGGWLAYDPNVASRSGLAQDTSVHGLVRISQGSTNIRQVATTTSTVEALQEGPGWLHVAADLTPAYNGNAAVQNVQREMLYLAPDVIVVYDRVATAANTTQTWQLAAPVQPAISGNSATITSAGHSLAITKLSGGAMSTYDFRSNADFTGGWRLDETQSGGDRRYLHVMSIDGAATTITAVGETGARIVLRDGRTATVTFDRDAVGASLTIDNATTSLAPGVSSLAP
jgi:hypothetical protein